jgi:hypothetical protein
MEDRWFDAVDGRVISVDRQSYRLQVLGIHRDGEDLWIQLAPLDDWDRGFVIRCRPQQMVPDVLAALGRHLRSDRPDTLLDTRV